VADTLAGRRKKPPKLRSAVPPGVEAAVRGSRAGTAKIQAEKFRTVIPLTAGFEAERLERNPRRKALIKARFGKQFADKVERSPNRFNLIREAIDRELLKMRGR
jgi:hypothetical protein